MLKQIRNFFKSIDTSIETPDPDVSGLLVAIDSKDLIPKDLELFIKKVYYKHFLQYIKTGRSPNQPELNSNDAWLEIKPSIDNYVDETMDSITDAIDSYIGWIESDIDDYAEGIFEQHEGQVRSVRNPLESDESVWNTEADSNEPQIGGKDTCTPEHLQGDIQPHSKMCQCVECKQLKLVLQENPFPKAPHAKTCPCNDCQPLNTWNGVEWVEPKEKEEKKENLVDWEDADKAW